MNERTVRSHRPTMQELRAVRDEILRIAEKNGAANIRIFGSVARGDAIESSDVDVLVDIVANVDGFEYFGVLEDLRRDLEELLRRDVHIMDSAALKQTQPSAPRSKAQVRMRDRILEESIPL